MPAHALKRPPLRRRVKRFLGLVAWPSVITGVFTGVGLLVYGLVSGTF